MPKIEELVEVSRGKIGADRVLKKVTAMGYSGTDHITRRAGVEAKELCQAENRGVHRPWRLRPVLDL